MLRICYYVVEINLLTYLLTRTKWQQVAILDIGILNGGKAHKATGPDEVLARLLKETADQFAIHSPCSMANSKRNPNLQEG